MEEGGHRCAVFCTADIPLTTLESLIERSIEFELGSPGLFAEWEMNISDHLVLMTSKDSSAIRHGMSSQVQPSTSPFLGETIDDVVAWFKENISQPQLKGYATAGFIVLQSEAVEDQICTLVSLNEDPYVTVRCDFMLALSNACLINLRKSLDGTNMRCFQRSGVAMTKDNYELAMHRGMYLDGMEVKVDEKWRKFVEEWTF